MSTIVTRVGKGSPLTWTEVDANFTNLNTDKIQSGNTAASLTITSATINGGTINGTTVGASTASSGAFTSITDSGNLTFTGTGNRIIGDFSNATIANRVAFQTSTTNGSTTLNVIPNGTSTTGQIQILNASDPTNASTGGIQVTSSAALFYAGVQGTGTALPLTMYTNGSERLRIDTSGNVGIGTASSNEKLMVVGAGKFTGTAATLDQAGAFIDYSSGVARITGEASTGGTLTFLTNPNADFVAERMRINSSGNVGIGTSSPIARLTIATGSSPSSSNIPFLVKGGSAGVGDDGGGIAFSTSSSSAITSASQAASAIRSLNGYGSESNGEEGSLAFYTNRRTGANTYTGLTEKMRIDSSGNVGIGTASPAVKLDVVASSNQFRVSTGAATSFYGFDAAVGSCTWKDFTDASEAITLSNTSNFINFTTNTSERMRIDSTGNLLVGTTSATWSIAGGISATGYAAKAGTSGAFSGNGFNINWTGSPQLWIDATNLGTITVVSDYRIKRNIQTQTIPALERVMALRPVTYQMADYETLFKASDDIKEGFIAHEVQEVIPSGAEGVKDDPEQIQSLRVDAILAVAVKAIQEQQTIINDLTARITTLEGK
jgi:hypothetical protein